MSLRPQRAHWFELLTTRRELGRAVEALAGTGMVEPESRFGMREVLSLQDLSQRMEDFQHLSQRYRPYWPDADLGAGSLQGHPARQFDVALRNLRHWETEARPLILRLEMLASELGEMRLLQDMLAHMDAESLDFSLLVMRGGALAARVFVIRPGQQPAALPESLLVERIESDANVFLLAVGERHELDTLAVELAALKPVLLPLRPTLRGTRDHAREEIERRSSVIATEMQRLQDAIRELAIPNRLPESLGNIERLGWLIENMSTYPVSENFAWVTGWTSDLEDRRLSKALAAAGVRSVLHFTEPPADLEAPMVIRNPWWAQPFELFASLLGTPSRDEVDPSRLLALLVPLLFGYMFGDVGQGLVLLLAGLYLQRRWPVFRLLVANGMAAMVFGVIFGSVFGREDIIPALWLHPVEDPLPVLMVPLVGGILVLLAGLVINAVEARWRGEFQRWLRVEAAVLLLYLAILGSFVFPGMHHVITIALLWYFTGAVMVPAASFWRALLAAAGALVENMLQLLINTISFVRVGAFALAHAGLSLAFNVMAETTGSIVAAFLVLLIGNVIVILLEGLVVSIQTTRLVLFEFFIRFLRASGRMFRPMAAPTAEPDTRRLT